MRAPALRSPVSWVNSFVCLTGSREYPFLPRFLLKPLPGKRKKVLERDVLVSHTMWARLWHWARKVPKDPILNSALHPQVTLNGPCLVGLTWGDHPKKVPRSPAAGDTDGGPS